MRRARRFAALVALSLVAAACGSGGSDSRRPTDDRPPGQQPLVAQAANYELVAGEPSRFILGLLTKDNLFVTAGTATIRFSFLGEGNAEPEFVREETATFLSIPGEEPEHEHAEAGPASQGRGVYVVHGIEFDRAGFWQADVAVDLGDDGVGTGSAAFEVLDEPQVPAVGERALRTENLTLDSEAPPSAIDSLAGDGGEIPDPELHRTTIADAIRAGRPALVTFSTPAHCVSRFCGPITDMIAGLAADYSERAEFIHVEVWRSHQNGVINEAAAEWLFHDDNLNEPWVFLIGADGRIAARWDNVATREEIEPLLEALPTL